VQLDTILVELKQIINFYLSRLGETVMPELRKDPIIDNWVIISTERGRRPLIDRRDACPTNDYNL